MDSIQTKLLKNSDNNSNESIDKDELRYCVTNLLDNISTIDDNNDSNEDEEEEEEKDGDMEELRMLDMNTNDNILIDNTDCIDQNNKTLNHTLDVCHKWALVDIFAHGNTVLRQKNI